MRYFQHEQETDSITFPLKIVASEKVPTSPNHLNSSDEEIGRYIRQKYITDSMLQIEEDGEESLNNSMVFGPGELRRTLRVSNKRSDKNHSSLAKELVLIQEGRDDSSASRKEKSNYSFGEKSKPKTAAFNLEASNGKEKEDLSIREIRNHEEQYRSEGRPLLEDFKKLLSTASVQRKNSAPHVQKQAQPQHSIRQPSGPTFGYYLKKYSHFPASTANDSHERLREVSNILSKHKQPPRLHRKGTSMANLMPSQSIPQLSVSTTKKPSDECRRERGGNELDKTIEEEKKTIKIEMLEEMLQKQDRIIDMLMSSQHNSTKKFRHALNNSSTNNMKNSRIMINEEDFIDNEDDRLKELSSENHMLNQRIDLLVQARSEDLKKMYSMEERIKRLEYLLSSKLSEEMRSTEKLKSTGNKAGDMTVTARSYSKMEPTALTRYSQLT